MFLSNSVRTFLASQLDGSKTSLYTTFLVNTPECSSIEPFFTNTLVAAFEIPRDKSTYNWP